MARASASIDLPISAEEVWRLIGGFGSLPDWNPPIATSKLAEGGRVRHLTTKDGTVIVERLTKFDEANRSYTYEIVRSPIPQRDYVSTLRVSETGEKDRAHVEWSGEFKADGVRDDVVIGIFQGIYDDGLQGLREHFNRRAGAPEHA